MTTYIHNTTGWRFTEFSRGSHTTMLVPIEPAAPELWFIPNDALASDFTKVDDLLDLAEAVGVVATKRGEQPQIEFAVGPTSIDPWFSDEYLAAVVARWSAKDSR